MALCAKCQREAPQGALFCPFCSTPIVPARSGGEPVDPLIGKKINDTYLVQQKIGGGGMGQVYKAVQINLDRPVALKLLRPAFLSDPMIVQRFHREARASSRLHHPNIISVMDFGQTDDGTLFMAMEYVPARNLLSVMKEEFPLGEERVVAIAAQILSALAEAHRAGIVHRDLKPENVMVETRPEEPDFVKVLDFGIAQIQEPSDGQGRLTQAGVVCGTPDYMSPEQAALLPLDSRSDLYAVGVMLYEMLTGRHPFQATTPPAMVQAHVVQTPPPMATRSLTGQSVSPALEAVVMRALEKHPDSRFQSAEEMRRELLTCPIQLLPSPETAPSPTLAASAPRPSPPGGTRRQPTPLRPSSPSFPRPRTTPRPASTGSTSAPRSPTPLGRSSPAPLTEPLLRSAPLPPPSTTSGSAAPERSPGRGRRTRILLAGAAVVSALVLTTATLLHLFGGAASPPPPGPSLATKAEPTPSPMAEPDVPADSAPAIPSPPSSPPAVASAATSQPEPPREPPPAVPPPPPRETEVVPRSESKTAPAGKVRPAPAKPVKHSPALSRSAPEPPSVPSPPPTPARIETATQEPPRAASPAMTEPTPARREIFATREVLAFQQYFGNPELKERGMNLVTDARWSLEPNGSLVFTPLETMGGVFPMTVRATRDGNRVWFEGRRTARAGSGTAYVRLSGDISLAATNPLLTLDLEIGRVLGAEGSELDPTYRARSRLRLERVH